MDVTFSIKGADDAMRRLKAMTDEKRVKKIVRAASRKGMAIVREAARANARKLNDPATAEDIARNIEVQEAPRAGRAAGGIVMRVGVRGGSKQYTFSKRNVMKGRIDQSGKNAKSYKVGGSKANPGGDTFYWRFLEFGTAKMAARPFMRKALESNAGRVRNKVAAELTRLLDKAGA